MKTYKDLRNEETTWSQDFAAKDIDQIIKRTKKILSAQFSGKKLSKSDEQYWNDYVSKPGIKRKPIPKM